MVMTKFRNPEAFVIDHDATATGLVDIYPQTLRLCQWMVARDLMKLKGYR